MVEVLDKSLYYDANALLSHNRILNFLIGARGIGKSYAFKKYPINRFLKHGEQFIYVRRYKTELKKLNNYFDDIKEEFPDTKFEVKGREFRINGETCGWAIPLSTWQTEKSNTYPNVSTIIFDEFIREKDMSGYIPNEVGALLNLMDTVFRGRDNVRTICMSNAVTVVNPYFLYFNLVPDIKKRFNAYHDIVVEIPDSTDFSIERRKTKFGSLIDNTEYAEMSLDNVFTHDSNVFVDKRTPDSKFKFAVVYQGLKLGVWVDVDLGLMYLSNDFDPSSKHVFALTTDDLDENTMLMTNWREHYFLRKMVGAFKKGFLRFDTQIIRNISYEMFNKMRIH